MSEELIQRGLLEKPERMGEWDYYNIGSTTLRALKDAGIIPQRDYERFEGKKPDALIINKPAVVAVVEYKRPDEFNTDAKVEKAVAQELGTARALGARLYIATDGDKTVWVNPATGNRVVDSGGQPLTARFDRRSPECVALVGRLLASVSAGNDALLAPTLVDPLPLARQCWQDLWAVSGATPENCLYTFVEIFIFKYMSDLGVLTGAYSFGDLVARYKTNSDDEVLQLYADTVRRKIKECFPGNPRDNTTIINGTIFVSKDDHSVAGYATVFRKILERFAGFGPLENIDRDFKSRLFETFLKQSISKKNWGQFFTPLKVVQAIVGMADVRPGMTICDPACGVGKFLLEAVSQNLDRYYSVEGGELQPRVTLCGFDKGFDREEQKTIILAKANMLIYLSSLIRRHPGLTTQFAGLFNDTFLLQTNSILGTLARPAIDEYDLILTNPPYVMSGSGNLKDEINKDAILKRHYSVSAMGVEGLFMEWIVRALKPGGKAFVVVPDGLMNRGNDKKLRDFILDECFLDAVISLPLNTFFTTNKKTYIMALTKKETVMVDGVPAKPSQTTPVFTYLCSEIGETRDMYRFELEQNDLAKAARLFNMFKGAKECFSADDPRCKVASVARFRDGGHWSVERWWSREERVALGIAEESERVSVEGFIEMVDDMFDAVAPYKEALRDGLNDEQPADGVRMERVPLKQILCAVKGKSKYTRAYGNEHRGEYPVFSASASTPLTSIDTYDYDGEYLSWSTNGFAGTMMILKGRFSINGDRGLLLPKKDGLDLAYLRTVLEPIFRRLTKGRKGDRGEDEFTKLYPSMIEEVLVPIPVNDAVEFDLDAQKRIAAGRGLGEAAQAARAANVPLTELFDIERGSGKYTKAYARDHAGKFPLYSGNTFGEFAAIDTCDYDTPCLSWAIDGLAGCMMVHREPFSATNHRGVLLPKKPGLDLDYIKLALEPVLRQAKKGRVGERGENEYTSLPPSMLAGLQVPVPVKPGGTFDLEAQRAIAGRHRLVEQLREELRSRLARLEDTVVDFT